MNKLDKIIREDLRDFEPYSSARNEYSGQAKVFLDANENPYGSSFRGVTGLNRYPDPMQMELKEKLAGINGLSPEQMIAGNGSDEILDLAVRAVTVPGRSNLINLPPTYGMYRVVADINNIEVRDIPRDKDFSFNAKDILEASDEDTALVFICSPNNPTGKLAPRDEIIKLAEEFTGLIIIDEAYIDFSGTEGFIDMPEKYENILVLRTFSKAFGMAGARLGVGYGNPELIKVLNSIKAPYNVNSLTMQAALNALDRYSRYKRQIEKIIMNRNILISELSDIKGIKKVYPTDANFILVKADKAGDLYEYLLKRDIVVRDRSGVTGCEGCLRLTVGKETENIVLIDEIRNFYNMSPAADKAERSRVRRRTGETDIMVDIDMYGRGLADIQTGIGFLDHMLELFAFHSKTDLMIRASGDIDVDIHHTMEDIAISIGAAMKKVLENKKGLKRYGFVMPMDESRAIIALDIGGRSYLSWDIEFTDSSIGDIPVSMFKHFFKSMSDNAGFTINIEAKGEDDHHIIEAVFKGVARALRQAKEVSGENSSSTKDVRHGG